MSFPARVLALSTLLTAALSAQSKPTADFTPIAIPVPQPAVLELAMSSQDKDLIAEIALPGSFVGGLLLATDPTMRYFLTGLPGMLDQGVLVATGKTETGHLELRVPGIAGLQHEILGLELFGQALAIQGVVFASEVEQFGPAK